MLGSLLWKANILGCESCHTSHCYSNLGSEDEICIDNLSGISAMSLAFGIGGSLALAAISIVQPIIFWRKSDRAYGYDPLPNHSGISVFSCFPTIASRGAPGSSSTADWACYQCCCVRHLTECYRLLLPCIAFQLAFLCPADLLKGSSLSQPPPPKWWMFPIAFAFPLFIVVRAAYSSAQCACSNH